VIVDYHIHTEASPDAEGAMQEYVKAAQEKKIDEIGFSDHILLKHFENRSNLLVYEMPAYVQDFFKAKQESPIPIKLGAEVDFFEDKIEMMKEFVRKYPFDYVMGSVHVIGNWIVDDPTEIQEYSRKDLSQVYRDYFGLVRELCACELFDILGHTDLIKIFGFKPTQDLAAIYEETAETISRANICVEINPKGLIRPCREIYPSLQFLKILHARDVPITFGSDAHSPKDLGLNLAEAVGLAKKVGYREACTFSNRGRMSVKI
jgi:histidinol-phosphatase (PHP family)